jgi:UDP-N-acetylglucosamine--N-acetylmuramyl-(pentapeptide) pyrophosphoryl-undecaprenol N-acetylglucosamine transferase
VRVLISGGGTGGHVYPLLAVAEVLAASARHESRPAAGGQVDAPSDVEFLYVGSVGGMEETIVAQTEQVGDARLAYRAVDAAPIRGVTPWQLVGNVRHLWRGYRQSRRLLDEWPADVVLVSGAYVSVPVAFAARRRRIPVMVYLPDREPGLAVRLLSWFVDRIAVSFEQVRQAFPGAVRHKVWVSGYPVRPALLEADRARGGRPLPAQALDLDSALKTLLVMGGSRGARAINRALVAILPELLSCCQVVHIVGQLDWPWVEAERAKLPPESRMRYRAYPYLHEDLPAAMAAADLVVARAGAATLAEFPAVGLPSVLVPYPYSGQHQEANADFMVAAGASIRIDDADLDSKLKTVVLDLLRDECALGRMREAARALARPEAAARLAKELCRLAQVSPPARG